MRPAHGNEPPASALEAGWFILRVLCLPPPARIFPGVPFAFMAAVDGRTSPAGPSLQTGAAVVSMRGSEPEVLQPVRPGFPAAREGRETAPPSVVEKETWCAFIAFPQEDALPGWRVLP